MSTNCSDIFRDYNGTLAGRIVDPVPIAADLFQEGVITLPVKQRVELNTTPAHERTSQMLSAVYNFVRGDFKPPNTFLKVIKAFKKHSETREIARMMESRYCKY